MSSICARHFLFYLLRVLEVPAHAKLQIRHLHFAVNLIIDLYFVAIAIVVGIYTITLALAECAIVAYGEV